ncbi:hypothetical protein BJ508DRAFT_308270 [Ascobolus immersus RN42]|uniref:Uncharacterized protein n=1 Tax=Ascobolus immersus RN42 TaxID=1160509 RepID=A0A3N4I5R2_ASCIM|nr:hypothetical protein BJ508DRAFT_308270 [Ascobolus immersus RN42]
MNPDSNLLCEVKWGRKAFQNPQDKERHRLLTHCNLVINVYACNDKLSGLSGRDEAPHVKIYRSLDLKFHCAVQGCNNAEIDRFVFIRHCKQHLPPLSLKDGCNLVTPGSLAKSPATDVKLSGSLTRSMTAVSKATKRRLLSRTKQNPVLTRLEPFGQPETVHPLHLFTSTRNSNSTSTSFIPEIATPKLDWRNLHSPVSPQNKDAGTQTVPFSETKQILTTIPPTAASTNLKRKLKADPDPVGTVEEMKARLRSEYQRILFEESMKTMKDPEADWDASSRRREKMAAYFHETMDFLDAMGCGS